MTNVKITKENKHYRIEAKGHATGSEQVCSAISMLMFTLANYLSDIADYQLDDGDAYIDWYGEDPLFDMAKGGFEMLARDYPDYVKIV